MDEFLQSLEGAHPKACADEAEWWTAPLTHSAVRALIDTGLFAAWEKAGGGIKSSAELAELTGTDTVLIKPPLPHFFTPQPLRGARAYYLHSVPYDWHDDGAVRILAHLAGALEPGYSRVLIHESVVNALRSQSRVTTADLAMMAILPTKERTEEEFEKIIPNRRIRGTKVNRSDFKMKLISCFIV
ncbi:uncharacterized protein PG998_014954 [Apiospora kogelbergensis]|uniref:uncharacterized protein n=1 Tax=Apiospora kogelbergensis TaxID=1337665 RepID=UPI00312EEBF2